MTLFGYGNLPVADCQNDGSHYFSYCRFCFLVSVFVHISSISFIIIVVFFFHYHNVGYIISYFSAFNFLVDSDCPGFKVWTKMVDDSNDADIVESLVISGCVLMNFVMVKFLISLVIINFLKLLTTEGQAVCTNYVISSTQYPNDNVNFCLTLISQVAFQFYKIKKVRYTTATDQNFWSFWVVVMEGQIWINITNFELN